MQRIILATLCITFITVCSCNNNTGNTEENNQDSGNTEADPTPAVLNYTVVNIFPHDTTSFTEGLFVHNGTLYESTGSGNDNRCESWAGTVDLKTGRPQRRIRLDKQYFGEGTTILNGKLYQLTWQNHTGFVYDAATWKKLKEFNYTGEGWALTHDSTHLIMSDGTNRLQYLDPASLKVIKIIGVQDNYGPVGNINELEYIDGYIYANQWQTNYILKIDPASGRVVAKADFTKLAAQIKNKYPAADEMNGIAWDKDARKLYITGKCWPELYEIRFN